MIKYHCKKCNMEIEQSTCSVCGERAQIQSRLFWCKHCNIPTYDEVCPICGQTGTYFTSDARPVFPEERLLLEILLEKPLEFINDSVWNGTGNRYYINGKRIPFSIANLRKYSVSAIIEQLNRYKLDNSYEAFERYIGLWVQANSKHYSYVTTEAKQYITGISQSYILQFF